MATMRRLEEQAGKFQCSGQESRGAAAASSASALLNLTPAGPALSLTQGVLGMLATEASTSSVVGTITDQAFLNGVGRQLQALKLSVLMPKTYSPYSLVTIDVDNSPFLASLTRTLRAEACLKKSSNANDPIVQNTILGIDQFRCTLGDVVTSTPNAAKPGETTTISCPAPETQGAAKTPASAEQKPSGEGEADKKPDSTTEDKSASSSAASNHLSAVLSADGLAQALGFDAESGEIATEGTHILLLKALESGGSVSRRSNILGTKLRYSGGSVGTYALFDMSGALECSGNVYDYGGSLEAKDFERDLRTFNPDPSKQVIFQHGSCRPAAPAR